MRDVLIKNGDEIMAVSKNGDNFAIHGFNVPNIKDCLSHHLDDDIVARKLDLLLSVIFNQKGRLTNE